MNVINNKLEIKKSRVNKKLDKIMEIGAIEK